MTDYKDFELLENPLESFKNWFNEAQKKEDNAPAMTLSSIDSVLNRPNSRTVLLKDITDEGLIFYSNYNSHKAHDFEKNNEACLVFYWHHSKKQVRIQGRVVKTSREVSKAYFDSRDRQSQLASYMSEQSSPVADKAALIKKLNEVAKKFENVPVELPENWGGYLFLPYEFEFFLYGDYRINDRFLYEKENSAWKITRLQP